MVVVDAAAASAQVGQETVAREREGNLAAAAAAAAEKGTGVEIIIVRRRTTKEDAQNGWGEGKLHRWMWDCDGDGEALSLLACCWRV